MTESANLIVIETCYENTRVMLIQGDNHRFLDAPQPRKQAQSVLVLLDELLTQAEIGVHEISAIAYINGPGSFTGIRIGAAVVEGIALAHDLPVYGISSLKVLAYQASKQGLGDYISVLINAHMQEVYHASFKFENKQLSVCSEAKNSRYEDFLKHYDKNSVLVGNGLLLPELSHLQGYGHIQVSAQTMAEYVLDAYSKGLFSDVSEHQPQYLRNSIAWKKLSEQPKLLQE